MSANPAVVLRAFTLAVMIGLTAALLAPAPIASQQVSAEKAPQDLAEGEFVWTPEASPSGPIVVVVSLTEQRASSPETTSDADFVIMATQHPEESSK